MRLFLGEPPGCDLQGPSVRESPDASQSHPDGSDRLRALLTPDGFPRAARTIGNIFLKRQSGATRLNTDTMTDLPTLAAALLANFRNIRFPAPQDGLRSPSRHALTGWK
jgi:hypothetical protein